MKQIKGFKNSYILTEEGIKKTKQQDRDVIGFLAISTYKTKRMPIPDRTK